MIFQLGGVYTTTGVGLGLGLGLHPQDSHPGTKTQTSHMHATINDSPGIPGNTSNRNGKLHMKNTMFMGKIMNDAGNAPRQLRCK